MTSSGYVLDKLLNQDFLGCFYGCNILIFSSLDCSRKKQIWNSENSGGRGVRLWKSKLEGRLNLKKSSAGSFQPIVHAIQTLACLQACTGGFIVENPVIGCHLGFLRRALPCTSRRAQKSSVLNPAQTKPPKSKMATSL